MHVEIQGSAAVKFNPSYTLFSGGPTHEACGKRHKVQGRVSVVGKKLLLEYRKSACL